MTVEGLQISSENIVFLEKNRKQVVLVENYRNLMEGFYNVGMSLLVAGAIWWK